MRTFLISALLLSLVSGCSSVKLGPHRIDVQQGNALDQENVARLKTGLNRSQVRFLLGTPLVVDPFRTDRWDYVYVNYKAGKLAEQKRITLFFDGDTLVRIEGDVPAAEPVASASGLSATPQPTAAASVESPVPSAVEARPLPQRAAPQAEPIPRAQASRQSEPQPPSGSEPARATAPQQAQRVEQQPVAQPAETVSQPAPTAPARGVQAPASAPAESRPAGVETSVVKPLPNSDDLPPYRDPRAPAELSLLTETNVERLRPDVVPAFPDASRPDAAQASGSVGDNEAVLWALRNWAKAWSNRDEDTYFAAYDADFVPEGQGTRAEWERRRRALLGVSKPIEVKIDSPSIDYLADGSASVIFTQSYRSGNVRDAVVKQVRLVKREEQWLIIAEKVLSVLKGGKR